MGRHEFAHALVPHAGGWREAGIVREGVLFNAPLRWTEAAPEEPFASVDDENLVLSSQRGVRNAVVSLTSPPPGAQWKFSTAPVFLDQRQCVFIPRVTLVPAGGTVDFLNSDRLLHNIHSTSKGNRLTIPGNPIRTPRLLGPEGAGT